MTRQLLSGILCIVLFLGFCSPAGAATTGKVTGRVIDDRGDALPGASVVLEGTKRGATSDLDGYYFILSVEPGIYQVRATMVGYSPSVKTGVRVRSDLTTTTDLTLREATLELGELIVVAERPPVEMDVTESRYVVSAEEIDMLPIVRSTEGFIELEAGVNVDGSGLMRDAYVSNGSGETAEYVVDGVKMTALAGGGDWTGNVNISAVAEVTVLAGGLNAEYGHLGSIQIVTKDGGRDYHGQAHYRYSPAQQQHFGNNVYESFVHKGRLKSDDPTWANETDATGRAVHQRPEKDYADVRGHFLESSLSGPISQDLSFIVSSKHGFQPRSLPQAQQRTPFNADVSYKLTYGGWPNLKVRVGGLHSQRESRIASGFDSRGIFLPQANAARGGIQKNLDNMAYVSATHILSPKTFYEVRLSYITGKRDTADVPSETVKPLTDEDGWFYTTSGANRQFELSEQNRLSLRTDFSSQMHRSHFIKAGFHLVRYDAHRLTLTEKAKGKNRYMIYFGNRSRIGEGVTPSELFVYLQDKMEFEGLIINAGLRLERFWGAKAPMWPSQGSPMGLTYTRYMKTAQFGDMQPQQWILPRLGISHPITSRSKLHFFYGRFHTRPNFDLYFRQRWKASGSPSKDLNKNGQIDPAEENNNLKKSDGYGANFVTDDFFSFQSAQLSTAFELGAEWNFISDYKVQSTAYYRVTSGLMNVQEAQFVDPIAGKKGKNRTMGPRRQSTTRGLELSLKKGLKHNFSFKASLNLGWGDAIRGGLSQGNGEALILPDASYVSDPDRYWVDWTVDQETGEEIPSPPTGARLEQIIQLAENGIQNGKDGKLQPGQQAYLPFQPMWKQDGLSSEEQAALKGLWAQQQKRWKARTRPNARRTQGSLVLVYASPPDFGPGEKLLGSSLFGDIRMNLIYRIYTGRIISFTDTQLKRKVNREGPAIATFDYSFQKGFDIRGIRPLIYLEINNVFDFQGSNSTSANYVRWGLLVPKPDDPNVVKFGGDVNELTRFNQTEPRQVFAGMRVTW
jgi:hypothetical protein